jgi:hypothetical protein
MMIGASELEALLRDERAAAQSFREQVMQQDNESQQHSVTIERLSRKEKALEERCRDQVRILFHDGKWSLTILGRNGNYSLPRAPLRG